MNGLELSSHAATLETLWDHIYMNNVYIACISEKTCHWKNHRCYNLLHNVICTFWKRFHLRTLETKTPWPFIFKPGGTATIATSILFTRITFFGEDLHVLGRWSFIAFGEKRKCRLTIINVYRTCKLDNNCGVSTAYLQQWVILEETYQEHENIPLKMINDLFLFINELRKSHH